VPIATVCTQRQLAAEKIGTAGLAENFCTYLGSNDDVTVQKRALAFRPVHGRCVEMLIKNDAFSICLRGEWVAACCRF
jgi:hypothetical protein